MHIEKNIFDNIIETLLDIQGKKKDNVSARYDLKDMGVRKNLHPTEIDGGRVQFGKSCFSNEYIGKVNFLWCFKGCQIIGWDCVKYFKVCES